MVSRCKLTRAALVAACLFGLFASPSSAQQKITPAQTRDFEKIIREYLVKNPEIVIQALKAYKQKQEQTDIDSTRRTLAEKMSEIRHDPGAPVGGNPNGDVTLVEFFDYRCSVCKRVHPIVAKLIKGDRNIRRVYKEWPILGPESVFAARAALASRRQGKYLAFHKALMEAGGGLNPSLIMTIAAKVGLKVKQLRRDMENPEIDAVLKRNYALAEALKLKGTPSFVIGDELVRGGRDLATMKRIVARQRKSG